jgi:hypothetical protein
MAPELRAIKPKIMEETKCQFQAELNVVTIGYWLETSSLNTKD